MLSKLVLSVVCLLLLFPGSWATAQGSDKGEDVKEKISCANAAKDLSDSLHFILVGAEITEGINLLSETLGDFDLEETEKVVDGLRDTVFSYLREEKTMCMELLALMVAALHLADVSTIAISSVALFPEEFVQSGIAGMAIMAEIAAPVSSRYDNAYTALVASLKSD